VLIHARITQFTVPRLAINLKPISTQLPTHCYKSPHQRNHRFKTPPANHHIAETRVKIRQPKSSTILTLSRLPSPNRVSILLLPRLTLLLRLRNTRQQKLPKTLQLLRLRLLLLAALAILPYRDPDPSRVSRTLPKDSILREFRAVVGAGMVFVLAVIDVGGDDAHFGNCR